MQSISPPPRFDPLTVQPLAIRYCECLRLERADKHFWVVMYVSLTHRVGLLSRYLKISLKTVHDSVLCSVTETDCNLQSMRKVVTEVQLHLLSSCSRRLIHPAVLITPTNDTSLFNPLNPELNPICYLLALLAHHFLHVSRIRVKLLTLGY